MLVFFFTVFFIRSTLFISIATLLCCFVFFSCSRVSICNCFRSVVLCCLCVSFSPVFIFLLFSTFSRSAFKCDRFASSCSHVGLRFLFFVFLLVSPTNDSICCFYFCFLLLSNFFYTLKQSWLSPVTISYFQSLCFPCVCVCVFLCVLFCTCSHALVNQ